MLKHRSLDVLSLIGREQMRESPFFHIVAEEGAQQARREAVLQVLRIRFGDKAGEEFQPLLERIQHREQLQELHKIAVTSRRVSQFRRALAELQG
jgi:hypothetical protein